MIKMTILLFQAGFVFLTVSAAISDYQKMKIPNWISAALCILFAVYAWWLPTWASVGWHAAVGAVIFLAAVLSYAFGIFGGGDVKLLGAIALWAGPDRIVEFLMLTGILGGAFGVMIIAARWTVIALPRIADKPGAVWNIARWGRDGACPYGIPIAVAALISVPVMFTV